ncbi:GntR family transcriptional regulator [Weissella paramesenteroides]|jgi:GntR family transcriptional regulator|uniref:UbiC transcription regulator-associated domain protein n=1 Tax=Weissella paramesenteroides ATCC 33313 TaxID=585506 RepID=C5R8R4_WEIPA|nr:GntR family transcriptional regulator [Weissella paramesenteroides]ATF40654.1 GntR family transcriptional regulator [Weissella paramesenteroides]EER75558.1 UbiC transcription regulator-associated domain protein [Weissella paramesenteroides ATCC 33313]KAA8442087.1 GntR family transcriptional regulator [Weissella paramesenteroides]KAA8442331.1 GntR family transcriptional regulator [Weissella paramesenteroides]KAA8443725.1 GntR family transcriptional regulator [Weissella paramesenteroides]
MTQTQAKYRNIANKILASIQDGTYPLNSFIPKEMDLVEQFQVSRPTIRQAIQVLVNEGYLARRKKLGTWVKATKIEQGFTHVIKSYSDEMGEKGVIPKTKVISLTKMLVTPEIQSELQLTDKDTVFALTRLRYADDKPILLTTSYIPTKYIPDFDQHDFEKESVLHTFENHNLYMTHASRELELLRADETTAALLEIPLDDPLFYFHTITYTNQDIPVEYALSKYRGDISSFKIEINQ